ncbi:hypothetical protein H633G_09163 [Metarhizium anisopliae BRIP 53284]|nr:hypothetical protein H633G_09163 [Metarhizium anisopliae BRIP 53284]
MSTAARGAEAACQSHQVAPLSPKCLDKRLAKSAKLTQRIAWAILQSPDGKLKLSDIYKHLSEQYPEKYNPNDARWRNTVRHRLSVHRSFVNIKRKKNDSDPSNYWSIAKGDESVFRKGLPTMNSASEHEYVMTIKKPAQPLSALHGPALLSTSLVTSLGPEFDSLKIRSSSLDVVSQWYDSPLASRNSNVRSRSPPSTGRVSFRIGSQPRCHRQGFASTGIGRSEMQTQRKRFSSAVGRPRGCAEEEIARMLGSGPSPEISSTRTITVCNLKSSSPSHQPCEPRPKLPPAPVEKVNPVFRPQPSVSPSTSLCRRWDTAHHGLQSTLPCVSALGENSVLLSPPLDANHPKNAADGIRVRWPVFDIFQDPILMTDPLRLDVESSSSVVKPSVKQTPLDEPPPTFALGNVTNSAAKGGAVSTPPPKAYTYPPHPETPSKVFAELGSSSELSLLSPCRQAFFGDLPGVLSVLDYGD